MNAIVNLLTMLLKAVVVYIGLKNKSFYNDIVEKHYKRKQEIIDEIEKLRNKPTTANTNAADVLLLVLEQENKRFDDISAFYSKFGKTEDDSN